MNLLARLVATTALFTAVALVGPAASAADIIDDGEGIIDDGEGIIDDGERIIDDGQRIIDDGQR